MIHYTCDRCKREIDADRDVRYIVRLEIEAADEQMASEIGDDVDHLEDLDEILESNDDLCSSALGEELYQRKRYDLCSSCYRQFMRNPLGKEANVPFGFSKN